MFVLYVRALAEDANLMMARTLLTGTNKINLSASTVSRKRSLPNKSKQLPNTVLKWSLDAV